MIYFVFFILGKVLRVKVRISTGGCFQEGRRKRKERERSRGRERQKGCAFISWVRVINHIFSWHTAPLSFPQCSPLYSHYQITRPHFQAPLNFLHLLTDYSHFPSVDFHECILRKNWQVTSSGVLYDHPTSTKQTL